MSHPDRSKRRSLKSQSTVSDEIPTSSMADIAFLLIVYFMVTITLAATQGLDFGLPKDEPAQVIQKVDSVLVEIDRSGGLTVDDRAMPLGDLLAYLQPKLERNPDKPVILRPDPDAAYGDMLAVYDVLRQGKERLGLEHEIHVSLPTQREITSLWQ